MIATDYAKALYELGPKATMPKLRAVLERKGHVKLLPRIYAEYQKLHEREERRKKHQHPSAEQEQTRILLELYKRLVSTPN